MDLTTHDPYKALYDMEKVGDPGFDYEMLPIKRSDLDAVDYLMKVAGGSRSTVETLSDWNVVAKIFEFWTRRWPRDWHNFASNIQDIRATRARKDGYSKEKRKEGVRYLAAVDMRLMKLIKIIFPEQQWDRKFTDKFIRNIKISRVGERVDTFFTIPNAPTKRKTSVDIVEEAVKKHGNTNKDS